MLVVMADESGMNTNGYFAIAGFEADEEVWGQFNQVWFAMLEKHSVPYLHMLELSGTRGVYAGWTEGQRRAFLADALKVIGLFRLEAIGAVTKTSDFDRLNTLQKSLVVGPYFMCWNEMVRGAGLQHKYARSGERVDFVYSRQDDFKSKMRYVWRKSKELNTDYGHYLGELEFKDMAGVPGLQAADLLAYEVRHRFWQRDTRPDLPLRYPYRMLMEQQANIGSARIHYLPWWFIVAHANRVGAAMSEMVLSDLNRFGDLQAQLALPWMDPLANLWRLRFAYKWNLLMPYDRETYASMLNPGPALAGFSAIESRDFLADSVRTRTKPWPKI